MLRLTCLITSNDLINTGILWKWLFSLTTAQANVVSFVITHLNNITSLKVVASVAILVSEKLDLVSPKDFGMA